ncbi:AAA family ATPase [Pedobacter psychrodurus]|uniref:AAA family ATPase n=1 Tax=Pedobacter psychrodurus TaxID=2530456 RepID=UPI00293034C6|nr:AAA family ATPase [Pedobacter psychrodurus]
MNYFRLQDTISKAEFIQNGRPAVFLNQLKDVNIIVGANNSRKSRFLRNIIKRESKLVLEADFDLNQLFLESFDIFKPLITVSAKSINETILMADFSGPIDESSIVQDLNEYFSAYPSANNTLHLGKLTEHLKNINDQLLAIVVEDGVSVLKKLIGLILPVVTCLLDIYNYVREAGDNNPFPTESGKIAAKIRFTLPSVKEGNHVENVELKCEIFSKLKAYLTKLSTVQFEPFRKQMVYIPVLRSSRMLEGVSGDIFKATIIKQHNLSDVPMLSIETGLDLYDKIELARNGPKKNRQDFAEFESFISEVFFQSRELDIVAQKAKGNSEKHIRLSIAGEMDDVAIYDLGDGVQAVINLLFPIFTAPDLSWIFIDEPENNLHPGFQNIFIKAISENAAILKKNHRYFINTHSNHVLSETLLSTADAEILVFSRNDETSSSIRSFAGNEYATLEMLGVLNTSVLVSNCIIWVEGVTDRLYLRAFIYAYCNSEESEKTAPIEGMNYTFIEYAGSNLIHYDFIDTSMDPGDQLVMREIKSFFVNSNVFLLADSDFNKELKHEFYKGIKKDNFQYFNTELPEIENLIPDNILKRWLVEEIKCKEDEVELCFQSRDVALKLGTYFTDKFSYGKKSFRKFTSVGEGGTLRGDYKKSLAEFVYKSVLGKKITWMDLKESEIIIKLIEELLKFISDKNSMTC